MSRQITIKTHEMGRLRLYLISQYDGLWEEEWRPLQQHPVGQHLTRVSREVIEHAILGLSRPLVKVLGLFPLGQLHKLPSRECAHSKTCPMFLGDSCQSLAKRMPVCFEPAGVEEVQAQVSELVRLWRDKVYVVVVEEPVDARR